MVLRTANTLLKLIRESFDSTDYPSVMYLVSRDINHTARTYGLKIPLPSLIILSSVLTLHSAIECERMARWKGNDAKWKSVRATSTRSIASSHQASCICTYISPVETESVVHTADGRVRMKQSNETCCLCTSHFEWTGSAVKGFRNLMNTVPSLFACYFSTKFETRHASRDRRVYILLIRWKQRDKGENSIRC